MRGGRKLRRSKKKVSIAPACALTSLRSIKALNTEVRDNPTDIQRRTFLFELLCFAGAYDRAEKQLNFLADSSKEAQLGAILYHSALHGEKLRQDLFAKKEFPAPVEEKDVFVGGERSESS